MTVLGVTADEIRQDAEESAKQGDSTASSKKTKVKERSGIFGLAKDGTTTTQCLSSTITVASELDRLNFEIGESGKGDFYKAFLKGNMFQNIRKEITDYQGR